MKILLLPNYRRPEFLAITLDYLAKNENHAEYLYFFVLDYGYDLGLKIVIDDFLKQHPVNRLIYYTPQITSTEGKQSYSLLNGYEQAANMNPELIVMVEEDVFVHHRFLSWHEQANTPDVFCAIASKNHHLINPPTEDYLTTGHYQSIGVSFRPEIIRQYIAPHIAKGYCSSPRYYCKKHFPQSTIPIVFSEQDGLISRIQSSTTLPIKFSGTPLCYHAGYYGKNIKGKPPHGTLAQKIQFIRENCTDYDRMAQLSGGRSDCEPCPL